MARLLDYVVAVLGVWLATSVLWLGEGTTATRVAVAATGVVLAVAAIVALLRGSLARPARVVILAAGVWLIVAAVLLLGAAGPAAQWNAAAVGALCALVSAVALTLGPAARNFFLFSADGSVLMEVTALEFRGHDLAMKGKMMGAMPTVAYVRVPQVRQALSMVPPSVVMRLPLLVCRSLFSRPAAGSSGPQARKSL